MQRFFSDSDPTFLDGWATYRKIALTKAVRIDGPFEVETSEGTLTCADGYLAIDARGYYYPIAADEFPLIYEPADQRPDTLSSDLQHAVNKHSVDARMNLTDYHLADYLQSCLAVLQRLQDQTAQNLRDESVRYP